VKMDGLKFYILLKIFSEGILKCNEKKRQAKNGVRLIA
jgi:hypothetical protein